MLKKIVEVPVCMRCYCCEFEGKKNTRHKTEMYINSTKAVAKAANIVIWKCPQCGKVRVERFKREGEAARFHNYADKKGWVLLEDHVYKGRIYAKG